MVPSIFDRNVFGDLLDDPFERNFFGGLNPLYGKHAKGLMRADVKEFSDRYELCIDLPGCKKDQIDLQLRDGYLTVSAAKGLHRLDQSGEGRYLHQECYTGACSRTFHVGSVKEEDVKARYEDGVLTVSIPKSDGEAAKKENKIAIE